MKNFLIIISLVLFPSFAFAQTFDQDLYYSMQESNDVKELQEFLTDNNFYSGPITGNFFSLTLAGVKRFQSANFITPLSGYFGPKSRGKANEILAQAGISKGQVVTETGTITPVSIAPAKTTNDIVNSLIEQIKILQQQLVLLQQQQATLQQQNQQITQQTQTLQHIQQQTATPQQTTSSQPNVNSNVPTEISIKSNICNLVNFTTEYQLSSLLSNGNTDGRIFMNAYVLNQESQNFYSSNPTAVMTVTTSDHSNDKTLNGSGNTGPCGFHYPYEFYTTKAGTYTITYSIPTLNLSKSITITIKLPEKPIIGSSGITVSTPEKETDFPISEIDNISAASSIKYWFQTAKPESQYLTLVAQCSDADTPFSKVDMVSSLGANGLYYLRGFFSKGIFTGTVTCKFINYADSLKTIFSESDPITLIVN